MTGKEIIKVNYNNTTASLATFYIGEDLWGIDILNVQEINKIFDITPVPQAPGYVKGIINLRGKIVTIIDLGEKLGLFPSKQSAEKQSADCCNIIVKMQDEYIGLLVDSIQDITIIDWNEVEASPANIENVNERFFKGVFKTKKSLIGILDLEEVLSP